MTRRLYQEDSYRREFETSVAGVRRFGDAFGIALEATIFYPDSGGQPSDRGTIQRLPVVEVADEAGEIWHMVPEEPRFSPGQRVSGAIDWPRRFINMQQHTGQHILSQAFIRVFSADTVSSRLGLARSTIDVARLNLKSEEVEEVERAANSVVWEDRPVFARVFERASAGDLRIKQPVEGRILRVVEVEGYDRSPCGGTHCGRTGEVGLVKILRWEKVRESTRVEFVCGELARADYFWKNRLVVDLANRFTTSDTNLGEAVATLEESNRDLRRELGLVREELLARHAADLETRSCAFRGVNVISAVLDGRTPRDLRDLAARLTGKPARVVLLAAKGERVHFVFSRSADLQVDTRRMIAAACGLADGRGGGRPNVSEGSGARLDSIEEAMAAARAVLGQMLA